MSTGEWQFARHGGIPNSAITFEGIGKTDAQLEFAVVEAAQGCLSDPLARGRVRPGG